MQACNPPHMPHVTPCFVLQELANRKRSVLGSCDCLSYFKELGACLLQYLILPPTLPKQAFHASQQLETLQDSSGQRLDVNGSLLLRAPERLQYDDSRVISVCLSCTFGSWKCAGSLEWEYATDPHFET
eukprot:278083-Amphidinium_carterae.1